MTRLNTPGRVAFRPVNNVYTGLAAIGALATLAAAVVAVIQWIRLLG